MLALDARARRRPGPPGFSERWIIVEQKVPEAPLHYAALELLKLALDAFMARSGRDAQVYRNLAIRVDPNRRQIGFDPDLCLVEPAPHEGEGASLLLRATPRRTASVAR